MSFSIYDIEKILKQYDLLKEFQVADKWYYDYSAKFDDVSIDDLEYNSQKVEQQKETLFFCKGINFKDVYLEQAIKKGVRFYVSQKPVDIVDEEVVGIIVTDVQIAMAVLASAFFGHPEQQLTILGITGTKGKTTTAYFAKNILDQVTDQKVALLSTVDTTLDGKNYFKSQLSTPESLELFKMMRQALDNHMTHLVMEASSQAFKKHRVYGVPFEVGVFLNISPDHISAIEHPSFDDYLFCKRQIIDHAKKMVINYDSKYFSFLSAVCQQKEVPVISYGRQENADVVLQHVKRYAFNINQESQQTAFDTKLDGDFNEEDAAAAVTACLQLGASINQCVAGIKQTTVPGRMEEFTRTDGVQIYVDYAHNFDSLNRLLKTVREEHPNGQVVVVTGSTGKKGLNRRFGLGKAISNYADVAVLTTDDADTEKPAAIAHDIAGAIENPNVNISFIEDREQAIKEALKMVNHPLDAVVIAGKGEDQSQKLNGKLYPYKGDATVVEETIN